MSPRRSNQDSLVAWFVKHHRRIAILLHRWPGLIKDKWRWRLIGINELKKLKEGSRYEVEVKPSISRCLPACNLSISAGKNKSIQRSKLRPHSPKEEPQYQQDTEHRRQPNSKEDHRKVLHISYYLRWTKAVGPRGQWGLCRVVWRPRQKLGCWSSCIALHWRVPLSH